MMLKSGIHLILVAGLLTGCASTRVAAPAGEIGDAVATFQADLANFQDATQQLQGGEEILSSRNNLVRRLSAQALGQLQTEQALAEDRSFEEMLKTLQTQADAHVATLLAPPTADTPPTSADMPINQLSSVTTIVRGIAKPPGAKQQLQFLAEFAKTTNQDLNALQKGKQP
jgi:TolA-binding protein